jgi:hypothetical protein
MKPCHVVHPPRPGVDATDILDLLQARVLAGLFAKKVRQLVVKGGMAMRLAHDHARHTKDIDLDAEHDLSLDCVQRMVRNAVKQATAGNWLEDVVISEPKQTHTTARWKINGIDPATRNRLHLTVEVSFRSHIQDVDVVFNESTECGLDMTVPVYKDEVLAINKIDALLSPHRDAPRDVVDLFLLFQAGVEIPAERLSARLGDCDIEERIQTLWKKLESMDEKRFEEEILPVWSMDTLPPEWQDWLTIRLYVEEQVESCLQKVRTFRGGGGKR